MYYRLKCFTLSTLMLFLTFPVVATESRTSEHKDKISSTAQLQMGLYSVSSQHLNTGKFQIAGIVLDRTRNSCPAKSQQQAEENLQSLYQTLETQRKKGDRIGEADTLNKIGCVYLNHKEYNKALKFHQQALVIYEKINAKSRIAATLGSIGYAYFRRGEYHKIEELFRQKLESLRKGQDSEGENLILEVMRYNRVWQYSSPVSYLFHGKISWREVIEIRKLNVFVSKEIGSRYWEFINLKDLGWAYRNIGQYPQALKCYQQALLNAKKNSNIHKAIPYVLIDIAIIYTDIGQYDKALDYLQQALNILEARGVNNDPLALDSIGLIYKKLGKYEQALQFFRQALSKATMGAAGGAYSHRLNILSHIGSIYLQQGEYSKALESYQEALTIPPFMDEPGAQGFIFNNIGLVHAQTQDYTQALEAYKKALALFRQLNELPGESITLSNIGSLMEKQKQPELAIVFYKQSVNFTENIRQNLKHLTLEEQKAYTETVADNYRRLADLLLSQGRILEAQQVLELLKIQEIRNFTKDSNTRGENPKIVLSSEEQELINKYGSLIAFGQKVYECQKNNCSQLSELNAQLESLNRQYNQTTDTFVTAIRERKGKDDAFFDPRRLNYAQKIVEAQPNTVLIYPFVLQDKIWILWISAGGVVKSVEVPNTGQLQLGKTVLRFRQLIDNQFSDIGEVQATGKELYDLLIKPLEGELKANKVQNLVFALDSVTRYIPMSALYDGKNYLVENYNISTVLSAELTNTSDRLPIGIQNNPILALGLSNAVAGFPPLPNVPAELQAIVKTDSKNSKGIFPGLEFLNQDFNRTTLRDRLNGRKILHIATHGQFVPNNFLASFILLGTGEKFTVDDIRNLPNLGDVHLVVLSACQTALGDAMQDGVEISSISYYFLNRGAKAVMASLWLVDDQSTSELMKNFYSNLAKGTSEKPITKAEALRQAQLSLLHSHDSSTTNLTDRRGGIVPKPISGVTSRVSNIDRNFSHPYYWAPFILIGNGL